MSCGKCNSNAPSKPSRLPNKQNLLIGGRWVPCPATLPVFSPTDGSVICNVPKATREHIELAVQAAKTAFPSWSATTGHERARYMRAFAERVRANKELLAVLECTDCGKPLAEAEWDMDDVAGCFEYFATLAEKLDTNATGRVVDLETEDFNGRVLNHPVGVVAAITPWNYPLLMMTWKLAPALAAGCTVVLKPSEHSSLTALEVSKYFVEIGLPSGVLNMVTGAGDVGAMLVSHPLIDKITFTGSVPTGQRVMHAAADGVKNVSLELGGKSAAIVFSTSDIVRTVEWIMFGGFWTNGQICSATSRVLVHNSLYDDFIRVLCGLTGSLRIGSPLDRSTQTGPLINAAQRDKVLGFIRRARAAGARVLAGGNVPHLPAELRQGYYIQPTVIEVQDPDMEVWQEEIFGPVLTIMRFDTEETALQLANNTKFGLAGAVFSTDLHQCDRVIRRLDCGIAWINCSQPCFCQLPWGGVKQSGIGRDLGEEGLREYLQPKQVVTYQKEEPLGWFLQGETLELAETLRTRKDTAGAGAGAATVASSSTSTAGAIDHLGCCGQPNEGCECTSRCVCRMHASTTTSGLHARL